MERRKAAALISGACGAMLTRCGGGGGPSSPSSEARPAMGGIPVLAHYVTWHNSGDPGWGVCPSLPVRRDSPGGGYSSRNPAILAQHNAEMTANGIVPVCSWWERTSYAGDGFLDNYLPIDGPPMGILYEAVGPGRLAPDPMHPVDFNDPAVAEMFVRDMEHLRDKYFNGRYGHRFFRVDGRPLVFIWISNAFRGPFDKVSAEVRKYIYLVGSEFHIGAYITSGHEPVVRGLDAITSYGFYDTDRFPAEMNDEFLGNYATAIRKWREVLAVQAPGVQLIPPMTFAYDERGIPERQGYYFNSSAAVAMRYARIIKGYVADPGPGVLPLVWCTSYNEHYEGSGIEQTVDPDRPDYLGIVREVFTTPGP